MKLTPAQRGRRLEVVLAAVDIVRQLARGAGIADTALANPPASMTAVSSLDEQEPRETICVHCRKRNISAERESLTSHRRDRSFPLSDAEQILPCQVRALPHFFRGAGGAQHLPILITPQHAEDLRELETIDGTRKNPFELRPQVIILLLKSPDLVHILFGSRSTAGRCASLARRPPPPNGGRVTDPESIVLFQTGPPRLDLFKALHNPQQIGSSPFLEISETVLTQPVCESPAVTPAVCHIRAGNPHRRATADEQSRPNKNPIYPILSAVVFEPRPGVEAFADMTVVVGRWWDGPTILHCVVGSSPHQYPGEQAHPIPEIGIKSVGLRSATGLHLRGSRSVDDAPTGAPRRTVNTAPPKMSRARPRDSRLRYMGSAAPD